MKSYIIFFLAFLALIGVMLGVMSFEPMKHDGEAGYTGAPGEKNCTACHAGVANSGFAILKITSEPSLATGYIPGEKYVINITVVNTSEPNNKLFGVDAEILLPTGEDAGSIGVIDTNLTQIKFSSVGAINRTNLVHTKKNNVGPNTQEFPFTWTAPVSGSGPITIYVSINTANGDGTTSGDLIYTKSLAVTEYNTTNSIEKQKMDLSIYPNPSKGKFQINLSKGEFSGESKVEIYNSDKELVYKSSIKSKKSQIDLGDNLEGLYVVKISNNSTICMGNVLIE